jgi:HlyD family secretion protein
VGQFVTAGIPTLTIADFSHWLVKTDDLTELEVVEVQLGQAVSITLDALPDKPLKGKVTAISDRFEDRRGDVTFTVTISLDSPSEAMRWGMTGQVTFSQDK